MNKNTFLFILLFGVALALCLFGMNIIHWKFFILHNAKEAYIGFIAIIFTILGAWFTYHIRAPKIIVETRTEIIEKPPINPLKAKEQIEKLNLSQREMEVLTLLADGKSNASIANELYLSVSTIKTHTSNILLKLDAQNRTHAVKIAKSLNII